MKKGNLIKGICCWLPAILQASIAIGQEIKIGQQVPGIEMDIVFNYHSENIRLSDLKGKLVIVEFWGTGCTACLREFPKLDSLQKMFGDKLQILLVNRQDKEYTKDFLAKRKKIKIPAIPFVINKVLYDYFPHYGNPYEVWIDSTGKMIATPDSYILTSKVLEDYFAGKDLKFSNDSRVTYETTLFKPAWEPYLGYYSYISKCRNHGNLILSGPKKKEFSFRSGNCTSIPDLFKMAYNDSIDNETYKFGKPGRTILEVKDPSDYLYPGDHTKLQEWYDNHAYYYQSYMPGNNGLNRFRIMREDLGRYFFNIDAKVEIRKIKTIALVRTGNIDKIKSKGGQAKDNLLPTDEKSTDISPVRYFINKPFSNFSVRMAAFVERILGECFEDKTGYIGNIDIAMDGNIVDSLTMEGLRTELRKYDLDLMEEWIDAEVLVLREKDFKMTQQQAKLK